MRINMPLLFIVIILSIGLQKSVAMAHHGSGNPSFHMHYVERCKLLKMQQQPEETIKTIGKMIKEAVESKRNIQDHKQMLSIDMYDHQYKRERIAYLLCKMMIQNSIDIIEAKISKEVMITDFRSVLTEAKDLLERKLYKYVTNPIVEEALDISIRLLNQLGVANFIYEKQLLMRWNPEVSIWHLFDPRVHNSLGSIHLREMIKRRKENHLCSVDTISKLSGIIHEEISGKSTPLLTHNAYNHNGEMKYLTWLMCKEMVNKMWEQCKIEMEKDEKVEDFSELLEEAYTLTMTKIDGYYEEGQKLLARKALSLIKIFLRDTGTAKYLQDSCHRFKMRQEWKKTRDTEGKHVPYGFGRHKPWEKPGTEKPHESKFPHEPGKRFGPWRQRGPFEAPGFGILHRQWGKHKLKGIPEKQKAGSQ
jgi:hypothetical protein